MSPPSSRNTLKLKDKVRVLDLDSKNIYSRDELGVMFGAGKSQIYRIIRARDYIMRLYHTNIISDEFRRLDHQRGITSILDQSLLEWLRCLRNRQIHVTGSMMKKTALRMSAILGEDGFKASNGWLHSFSKRYKISFTGNYDDVRSTAQGLMASWKSKIIDVINEHDARDIFTVDETGLFLRALPSQLSAYENMRCSKGEMSEGRVTLLLCVNMKGEKEKPLVISSHYRGLQENGLLSPDIEWQYEERSFMTESIMTKWLECLDRKMGQQGRKVLLFLDHALSHQFIKMDNVTLLFIHPNFTPTWDPIMQGVVQNFKLNYRKRILLHVTETAMANELNDQANEEIDMCKAIEWIGGAWNEVTANTIQNAFALAGFPVKLHSSCVEEAPDIYETLGDTRLSRLLGILPAGTMEGYNSIDKNLAVEAVCDDAVEIVRHFLRQAERKNAKEVKPERSVASSADGREGTSSTPEWRHELEDFLVFNRPV